MREINELENKGVSEIKRLCGKYGISPIGLSARLNVVPARIYEILDGKRRITIDTDLRLVRLFGLERGHFFSLQTEYDFAMEAEALAEKLAAIVPFEKSVRAKK